MDGVQTVTQTSERIFYNTDTGSVPLAEWLICAFVLQITAGAAFAADTAAATKRSIRNGFKNKVMKVRENEG